MRKMALDLGDKKIGVAVSDALNITAQGKGVIERTDHRQDLEKIKAYIEDYDVGKLIVGLPKNMDNSEGPRVEKTRNYVNFLKNNLDIPVVFWDERLTTREAERMLIKADLRREHRRQVIDQVAASLILQNYLERQRRKKNHKKDRRLKMPETSEGTFWIDEEREELVLEEEGSEERFYIEREINLDDNSYLVLVPSEKGKFEAGEALVLKVVEDEEGDILSVIEDDEEFARVKEKYREQ